ncbi:MAG: hypothetical protein M3O34_06215 [Chloroflexota bacterium]|nr:hypothetical protein [Chloroflexota bacterium]
MTASTCSAPGGICCLAASDWAIVLIVAGLLMPGFTVSASKWVPPFIRDQG